jgi:CRP-like cAMP-binding protein
MLERFQGKEGRAALLNALRSQFLVDGNSDIADQFASGAQIQEYKPGERLFAQGERGTDVLFILAGEVAVRVGEIEIATCKAGTQVGEIALLEPFKGRSATVDAIDTVVVARVSGRTFTETGTLHPELWRRLGLGLARRLVDLETRVYANATA